MAKIQDVMLGKTMRKSFAKHDKVLAIPNMLKIQKDSYNWFLRRGTARGVPRRRYHHRLHRQPRAELPGLLASNEPPKYTVEECKERDATYRKAHQGPCAPAQQGDRRDQGAGDLHGRFPAHDQRRHLRHQRCRARHRLPDRPQPRHVLRRRRWTRPTSTSIPPRSFRTAARGWNMRPTCNNVFYVRIDKNRKLPITCLIRALGVSTDAQIKELFGEDPLHRCHAGKGYRASTREESLLEIYRKLRPGEPPTVDSAESLSRRAVLRRTPLRCFPGRTLQVQQEDGHLEPPDRPGACRARRPTRMTGEIIAMPGDVITRDKAHEISDRGVSDADHRRRRQRGQGLLERHGRHGEVRGL